MNGTVIPVEVRVASLLKDLKIGVISCTLFETQRFERHLRRLRVVESWESELDEYQDENGTYTLRGMLPLPGQLGSCLQDVKVYGIEIGHILKVKLNLHNPDGHISEVRAQSCK